MLEAHYGNCHYYYLQKGGSDNPHYLCIREMALWAKEIEGGIVGKFLWISPKGLDDCKSLPVEVLMRATKMMQTTH